MKLPSYVCGKQRGWTELCLKLGSSNALHAMHYLQPWTLTVWLGKSMEERINSNCLVWECYIYLHGPSLRILVAKRPPRFFPDGATGRVSLELNLLNARKSTKHHRNTENREPANLMGLIISLPKYGHCLGFIAELPMEPGSPTQAMSVMFSSAGIAPDVANWTLDVSGYLSKLEGTKGKHII